MSSRLPEVQAAYDSFIQTYEGECTFCDTLATPNSPQVVKRFSLFTVIKNNFPYALWDKLSVKEHLMIIPNRHVTKLRELDSNERTDYVQLLSDYEDRGYSIYSRATNNSSRTVLHQHTHLIDISS